MPARDLVLQRLRATDGTAAPPLPYEDAGTVWFGHTARRTDDELIKDLLLPTPPRTWYGQTGGQLKMWATAIKADLEPLSGSRTFGYVQWGKGWVKVSSELAQERRAWGECCHKYT